MPLLAVVAAMFDSTAVAAHFSRAYIYPQVQLCLFLVGRGIHDLIADTLAPTVDAEKQHNYVNI